MFVEVSVIFQSYPLRLNTKNSNTVSTNLRIKYQNVSMLQGKIPSIVTQCLCLKDSIRLYIQNFQRTSGKSASENEQNSMRKLPN